jgi:hypothetical protein
MKTASQNEGLRITDNRGKCESGRLLTPVLLTAGALLVFSLVSGVAAAGAIDFCKLTSKAALNSCKSGARSDYLLALGKCDNVSDPVERKACQQQAIADLKDALQTCTDQNVARQEICQRLGGAPYDPVINPTNFVSTINNPFMTLTPGATFVYTGQVAGAVESNVVAVTHNTKVILGVTCVEVHDTVFLDGDLEEDTLDWYAQDKNTNVWYFGENANQIVDDSVVGVEGSWTAGVDGAKPGIAMEGHPATNDFYRQEFLLDTAEDMAEVVGTNESVTVTYGSFNHCLKTKETSPIEPDAMENKFYAPGPGLLLIIDLVSGERLELVQILP